MRRTLPIIVALMTCSLGAAADNVQRREADWAQRVDRLVAERQPTADEKRFDQIGWLHNLRDALRLARASGRPVFLFTHDGHMAIGRC